MKHFKSILFSLIFVFSGCEPDSGVVVEKIIVPEHKEIRWIIIHGAPPTNTRIPFVVTVPEEYFIDIKDGSDTNRIRLQKSEYDSYEVNDFYPHRERP